MPSKKTSKTKSPINVKHIAFIPLLVLVFIVWLIYRSLFKFPIWFDETVGKAIFFGLPVWMYVSLTQSKTIRETFSVQRLIPGLFLGLAVGGVFGFSGVLASILKQPTAFQTVPLYMSDQFWWEFFLAIMTGFWETLFFYSWIMIVVTEKYIKWSLLNQLLMVSVIFLLFHVPNTLLRFQGMAAVTQIFLLFLFGLGQAILFAKYRNLYALTLSQAIWGMVIVIYAR